MLLKFVHAFRFGLNSEKTKNNTHSTSKTHLRFSLAMTDVYNKENKLSVMYALRPKKSCSKSECVHCDIRAEAEETVDYRAGSTVMLNINFLRGTILNPPANGNSVVVLLPR